MKTGEFLMAADVGKQLDKTAATIRMWARLGKIRVAATTVNGTRLFRQADVDRIARQAG